MNVKEAIALIKELPTRFGDRIPPDDLLILRQHAGGGEWGELYDLAVAVLSKDAAPVTRAEWDDLNAILAALDYPDDERQELADYLQAMNVRAD